MAPVGLGKGFPDWPGLFVVADGLRPAGGVFPLWASDGFSVWVRTCCSHHGTTAIFTVGVLQFLQWGYGNFYSGVTVIFTTHIYR